MSIKVTLWPDRPHPNSAEAQEIGLRQIQSLARQTPVVALGNLVNSALVVAVFWGSAPRTMLVLWSAVIWLASLARLQSWWRNCERPPLAKVSRRAGNRAVIWAVLAGALWGFVGFTLLPEQSGILRFFVVFVVGGMSTAAVTTLYALPAACIGFVLTSLVPLILRFLGQGDFVALSMAAMLTLYLGALIFSTFNAYGNFVDSVRIKLENVNLVQELTRARADLVDAIESLSDGFALWDAEDRLMLCNKPMHLLAGEHPDLLVPGKRYEEVLREGLARGVFAVDAGDEDAWIAERLRAHRGEVGPIEQEMRDDRWMLVSEGRTRNGGTVSVRTDITEIKRRERELRKSEAGSPTLSALLKWEAGNGTSSRASYVGRRRSTAYSGSIPGNSRYRSRASSVPSILATVR
jgi:PAS domain-containing protein